MSFNRREICIWFVTWNVRISWSRGMQACEHYTRCKPNKIDIPKLWRSERERATMCVLNGKWKESSARISFNEPNCLMFNCDLISRDTSIWTLDLFNGSKRINWTHTHIITVKESNFNNRIDFMCMLHVFQKHIPMPCIFICISFIFWTSNLCQNGRIYLNALCLMLRNIETDHK